MREIVRMSEKTYAQTTHQKTLSGAVSVDMEQSRQLMASITLQIHESTTAISDQVRASQQIMLAIEELRTMTQELTAYVNTFKLA